MKRSPSFYAALLFVFVAACFLTYLITFTETDKFWRNKIDEMLATDTSEMSKGLGELADAVGERYVYEAEAENLADGVREGYVSALGDKYSMYMDIEEHNNYLSFIEETSGVGVGVTTIYNSENDGICVTNVYKGSPADKEIAPGDMILEIDGQDVNKLGYYGSMCKLGLGDEGSEIKLRIKRCDGTEKDVVLKKREVKVDSITSQKLKSDIGLIRIESFENECMDDFKKELEKLLKSGCEKFVIDVRNNPGGNIEEIFSMLDFLIGDGHLFTVYRKAGAAEPKVSKNKSVPYPMALLINERTACGAEVFAGVLSSFDMAELVGTKTSGKATVQTLTELSDGSAVSLSTIKYVIGTDIDFDGKGFTPDKEVVLPAESLMKFPSLPQGEDAQLQAAIEYLKEKTVTYSEAY